jgi:hypothetical protein
VDSSLLPAVLLALLTHAPVFLVWTVGVLVALVRRSVSRRVAGLLVGGLAALALLTVVGTSVSMILPHSLMQSGHTAAQVGLYMSMWAIAANLLNAAGWVLVLLAIFVDREAPKA